MIEIHCIAENVREEVSDLFPDPDLGELHLIEDVVSHAAAGVPTMAFSARDERVIVNIVSESPTTERIAP